MLGNDLADPEITRSDQISKLISNADQAMYKAKNSGKGSASFYCEEESILSEC